MVTANDKPDTEAGGIATAPEMDRLEDLLRDGEIDRERFDEFIRELEEGLHT